MYATIFFIDYIIQLLISFINNLENCWKNHKHLINDVKKLYTGFLYYLERYSRIIYLSHDGMPVSWILDSYKSLGSIADAISFHRDH